VVEHPARIVEDLADVGAALDQLHASSRDVVHDEHRALQ